MNAWHVQIQGASKGPFSDAQLETLCEAGTVTASTLVWKQGFADWTPIGLTDFVHMGKVQPPTIPVTSPPTSAVPLTGYRTPPTQQQPYGAVAASSQNSTSIVEPELGFFAYGWRAMTEKYATFSGRARRMEYWAFALIYFLGALVVGFTGGIIDGITGTGTSGGREPVFGIALVGIFLLTLLIPGIAVSVRRLHDLGMSGWWTLIQIIPYVGAIIFFVFAVLPGQPQSNAYGPPTKSKG